jgi:hypothetical protein
MTCQKERRKERKELLHTGWLFRHTPHKLIDGVCPNAWNGFLSILSLSEKKQVCCEIVMLRCISPFQLLSNLNDCHETLYEHYVPERRRNAVGVFVRRLLKYVRLYACDKSRTAGSDYHDV